MVNLFIDLIIVLSLGAVLVILARALPRVEEGETVKIRTSRALVYLEKADKLMRRGSEKALRRMKLVLMKFDNALSKRLEKSRNRDSRNGGFKIDE